MKLSTPPAFVTLKPLNAKRQDDFNNHQQMDSSQSLKFDKPSQRTGNQQKNILSQFLDHEVFDNIFSLIDRKAVGFLGFGEKPELDQADVHMIEWKNAGSRKDEFLTKAMELYRDVRAGGSTGYTPHEKKYAEGMELMAWASKHPNDTHSHQQYASRFLNSLTQSNTQGNFDLRNWHNEISQKRTETLGKYSFNCNTAKQNNQAWLTEIYAHDGEAVADIYAPDLQSQVSKLMPGNSGYNAMFEVLKDNIHPVGFQYQKMRNAKRLLSPSYYRGNTLHLPKVQNINMAYEAKPPYGERFIDHFESYSPFTH
jgi:hypothetical protein